MSVDAERPEQRIETEGAGLIRDDGHDEMADLLVSHQFGQDATEGHGSGHLTVPRALAVLGKEVVRGHRQRLSAHATLRQESSESLAVLLEVTDLLAVIGGFVERCVGDVIVVDGDAEARAELTQLVLVHFLLIVADVHALAGLAQTVALDGVSENDRGAALVFDGGCIRSMNLVGIVTAAPQFSKLLVGQVLDHLQQTLVMAEQLLADLGAFRD